MHDNEVFGKDRNLNFALDRFAGTCPTIISLSVSSNENNGLYGQLDVPSDILLFYYVCY